MVIKFLSSYLFYALLLCCVFINDSLANDTCNVSLIKKEMKRPKAISQNLEKTTYSFYKTRLISIKLLRNSNKDYLTINNKNFLLKIPGRKQLSIDLDNILSYELKSKRQQYLVFLCDYSGAVGQLTNSTIYIIINIADIKNISIRLTDSYFGSIHDIHNDDKCNFFINRNIGKQKKIVVFTEMFKGS